MTTTATTRTGDGPLPELHLDQFDAAREMTDPRTGQTIEADFKRWLSLTWADIVAHPDPQERRKHELAGTGVDCAEGIKLTDPRRMAAYFSKYGTGGNKEYQHIVPKNGSRPTSNAPMTVTSSAWSRPQSGSRRRGCRTDGRSRSLGKPDAVHLVLDEKVAESFEAPTENPVERLFYAAGVLHCLPVGMVDSPSAGTGTVMRPATLRRYAEAAGFSSVEILPIEHDFFRLYQLVA